MRQREFITLLGLAASLPLAARAQKDRVRLVGMLAPVPEQDPRMVKYNAAFLDRLRRWATSTARPFKYTGVTPEAYWIACRDLRASWWRSRLT